MTLSCFDEKAVYGADYTLVGARNEKLLLEDRDGRTREFTDLMSAYGACNFGHCNSAIMPFRDYQADIAACFYPKEAKLYSEWLLAKLSAPDYEVLFQVGGSFAVSTALSIARRFRAGKIVHVAGSFHGLGLDSLGVTSTHKHLALQHTDLIGSIQQQCVELEPNDRLSSLGISWEDVSCFIYEPVQGANGYVPLPEGWLSDTITEAKRAGVVVIADEIQSGYFRHGHLSVASSLGLHTDIYLFSKSMTNGLFPFSAVVYGKKIKDAIPGDLYLAHTFQTSAMGCYAAMSVADYIDAHDVPGLCGSVERIMQQFAEELRQQPNVTGIYVTGPTLSFEVLDRKGREVVRECLRSGVITFTGGPEGQRIRVAPPLTIPEESLKEALRVIHDAVSKEAPTLLPL
jgi:4-aminobutyrate aminotransferase-like enzyme